MMADFISTTIVTAECLNYAEPAAPSLRGRFS
jgi:hypothetical protein